MSDEPLTCPYCNARQSALPGLVVGQKLACVRCGELYTLTHLPPAEAVPSTPDFTAPLPRANQHRNNRLIAAGILTVMVVMASVGLTYALRTEQTRRDHDKALPRKSRRPWHTERLDPPNEAIAPASLAGLGYLPEATGVLAVIQVEELLASEAGKELRSRSFPIGNGSFQLDQIKDWLGLAVEEIEHLILGVVIRVGDAADLTPPTQFIVRTRRPLDGKRVQLALKASRSREERTVQGKRTLYTASLRGVPATLWLADDRTFVVGLFGQFELVPAKPHDGLMHLRADLRQVIENRIPPGTPAWVVGHADDWKKTWLPTLAATQKNLPLMSRLEEVETFALWLIPSKPAKVMGAFRCADEATAKKIEQADLTPRARDNPSTFKFSREKAWIDAQLTVE